METAGKLRKDIKSSIKDPISLKQLKNRLEKIKPDFLKLPAKIKHRFRAISNELSELENAFV